MIAGGESINWSGGDPSEHDVPMTMLSRVGHGSSAGLRPITYRRQTCSRSAGSRKRREARSVLAASGRLPARHNQSASRRVLAWRRGNARRAAVTAALRRSTRRAGSAPALADRRGCELSKQGAVRGNAVASPRRAAVRTRRARGEVRRLVQRPGCAAVWLAHRCCSCEAAQPKRRARIAPGKEGFDRMVLTVAVTGSSRLREEPQQSAANRPPVSTLGVGVASVGLPSSAARSVLRAACR